jgi:hypothetical protein
VKTSNPTKVTVVFRIVMKINPEYTGSQIANVKHPGDFSVVDIHEISIRQFLISHATGIRAERTHRIFKKG